MFSDTGASVYKTVRRHNPEDYNLYKHYSNNIHRIARRDKYSAAGVIINHFNPLQNCFNKYSKCV
jgi:hypothetical protein